VRQSRPRSTDAYVIPAESPASEMLKKIPNQIRDVVHAGSIIAESIGRQDIAQLNPNPPLVTITNCITST
ncbi:MAG: hypothetical protein AB8H80_21670, partial [Planctomycetota bacterium]